MIKDGEDEHGLQMTNLRPGVRFSKGPKTFRGPFRSQFFGTGSVLQSPPPPPPPKKKKKKKKPNR